MCVLLNEEDEHIDRCIGFLAQLTIEENRPQAQQVCSFVPLLFQSMMDPKERSEMTTIERHPKKKEEAMACCGLGDGRTKEESLLIKHL